ncbi:C39 family peptidase [bacterium]|nr:C39 family peptidase [bacterium]
MWPRLALICVLLSVGVSSDALESGCSPVTNLASGITPSVTVVNNDANLAYEGESLSDITDGSLVYTMPSLRQEDGCVGWRNSVSGRTMTVTVQINLGSNCAVNSIRYNPGNLPLSTLAADTMTTPFGTTSVNGVPNAWTTQYATTTIETSTVTITLKKKNTAANRNWMFIGEIEVYGTVIEPPPPPTQVILGVSFLKQFYTYNGGDCGHASCGPASLSMCACYVLGRTPTYLDIVNVWSYLGRDTCGNESSGTSLTELRNAARGWPFGLSNVYKSTLTLQGVKNEITAGRPVLVHVQCSYLSNRGYSYTGGHYIAAVGYDTGYLICNDPGTYLGEHKYYSDSDMTGAMAYYGNEVLRGFYQ